MRIRERLEKTEARCAELESLLARPEAAKDTAQLQRLSKELARLRPVTEGFRRYRKLEREMAELKTNLAQGREDPAMRSLIEEEVRTIDEELKKASVRLEDMLLEGCEPDAARDVIVEIRAGTGGEEAALFAADLFRMYSQFAAENGLKSEVIDMSPTGIGGLKEIVFGVSGDRAYTLLKYESGIHRVQRVPTGAIGCARSRPPLAVGVPTAGGAQRCGCAQRAGH